MPDITDEELDGVLMFWGDTTMEHRLAKAYKAECAEHDKDKARIAELEKGLRNCKMPYSVHSADCALLHDDVDNALRGECGCGIDSHNEYIDALLGKEGEG